MYVEGGGGVEGVGGGARRAGGLPGGPLAGAGPIRAIRRRRPSRSSFAVRIARGPSGALRRAIRTATDDLEGLGGSSVPRGETPGSPGARAAAARDAREILDRVERGRVTRAADEEHTTARGRARDLAGVARLGPRRGPAVAVRVAKVERVARDASTRRRTSRFLDICRDWIAISRGRGSRRGE